MTVVLLLLTFMVLNSCAELPATDSYYWRLSYNAKAPVYEWHQTESAQMICKGFDTYACAFLKPGIRCDIFSRYSEEVAAVIIPPGSLFSMRDHEMRHCLGWVHE